MKGGNIKALNILQNTLEWYLENISPDISQSREVISYLTKIKNCIDDNRIKDAAQELERFYIYALKNDILNSNIGYPGPGNDFKELFRKIFPKRPNNPMKKIAKETLRIKNSDYEVLGLLLRGPNGVPILYDQKSEEIISTLPKSNLLTAHAERKKSPFIKTKISKIPGARDRPFITKNMILKKLKKSPQRDDNPYTAIKMIKKRNQDTEKSHYSNLPPDPGSHYVSADLFKKIVDEAEFYNSPQNKNRTYDLIFRK